MRFYQQLITQYSRCLSNNLKININLLFPATLQCMIKVGLEYLL